MELASRILSILLGLAVVALLLWPINIPLGFGQAWWAKEVAAKRESAGTPVAAEPPTAAAAVSQAAEPAPSPAPAKQQAATAVQTHAVAVPSPSPAANVPIADDAERLAALQTDQGAAQKPKTKLYYKVRVIDAGTIQSGAITITLAGIAVRDAKAACKDAKGRAWACGEAGRVALAKLIRARAANCTLPAGGEQTSFAARCSVAGTDLSTWLVRQGWANPKDGSDKALADAADAAKKDRIGLWRGAQ
jgi:endonuclease YncB( thermonuclease family)